MKSAHREDNSRAESGEAQGMLMGKQKHSEEFTATHLFLSKNKRLGKVPGNYWKPSSA